MTKMKCNHNHKFHGMVGHFIIKQKFGQVKLVEGRHLGPTSTGGRSQDVTDRDTQTHCPHINISSPATSATKHCSQEAGVIAPITWYYHETLIYKHRNNIRARHIRSRPRARPIYVSVLIYVQWGMANSGS